MELIFEEEIHRYSFNGIEIPSVTHIMKFAGIIDDKFYNEDGKLRGHAIHMATQFLDEDSLDHESLHEEYAPYIKAYEKFKNESGFKPALIEYKVIDLKKEFAGTLDRTGHFANGSFAILDIKTGSIPKWAGIQLAAYSHALGATLSQDNIKRFALQLKNNGKYKLQEFNNPRDIDVFLAAKDIFHLTKKIENWRNKHG